MNQKIKIQKNEVLDHYLWRIKAMEPDVKIQNTELLDQFAIASIDTAYKLAVHALTLAGNTEQEITPELIAAFQYKLARAMLKEREKSSDSR